MIHLPRRRFLRNFAATAGGLWVPGAYAEALLETPRQVEGPFYPVDLPLDTDNDLVILNDSLNPALGTVTHLSGKVMDVKGDPIRNAMIEIWQVDHHGVYLHKNSDGAERREKHFQGFGRFLTGSTGDYYFRTIKPVAYPGRTPHIHVAVKMKGHEMWTTQCYIKGEAMNQTDVLLNRVKDKKQRDSLIVDFKPIKESKVGELAARFDLIMGFTPKD